MAAAAKEKNPKADYRKDIDADLVTYLRSLQAQSPIKVTVIRRFPVQWEGQSIKGTLDTFDEPVSEDDIRDMYGGGKYQLTIRVPDDESGGWVYATTRTLEIAGNPKPVGQASDSAPSPSNGSNGHAPTDDAVKHALRMSQSLVDKANEMADRERESLRHQPQNSGLEFVMREMGAMREQQAEQQQMMFRMLGEKKDSVAEMLLGKAIDGESARMQQLRAQIDSELRMKADMHRSEVERIHATYADIARRQEDQHKREIDNLNRAIDGRVETLKASHESVVNGYKREIAHLDRELSKTQTELAELRARKDKGPAEAITELAVLKEAMESLTGGGGDKEESQSTVERILGSIMGSPLAEGVAARLAGPAAAAAPRQPAQPEPEPEPDLPVNRPMQLPDGRVVVRRPDGSVVQLRNKKPAIPEATQTTGISDEDLQAAMQFMESSLHNDSDPAEFARTAALLVPQLASGPLLEMLRTQGVDALLGRMAKLSPHSPLLTQQGKNWTRKVAAALLK